MEIVSRHILILPQWEYFCLIEQERKRAIIVQYTLDNSIIAIIRIQLPSKMWQIEGVKKLFDL